jgi:hypothetical protein
MRMLSVIAGMIVAIGLSLTLASCSGGGADVQTETRTTTTGQELLDLQRAKNAGVISESEYNRQRTMILNRKN